MHAPRKPPMEVGVGKRVSPSRRTGSVRPADPTGQTGQSAGLILKEF